MLARPVARVIVPFEQTRLVSVQPGTGSVSWIVLVPVASAPVKVKVRVLGSVASASSSRLKPLPKAPPPVPVVVYAKSWGSFGTASLVTVIVAAFWVFVYVQVTASPGSRAMLARPVARVVVPFEQARLV